MIKRKLDVTWNVDTWESLSAAIAVRTFKKCFISNKIDSTEDDIHYEELMQKVWGTEVSQINNDDGYLDRRYLLNRSAPQSDRRTILFSSTGPMMTSLKVSTRTTFKATDIG